jgi:FKBP-type peptidyl-prolyl cis-trans isomerase 2
VRELVQLLYPLLTMQLRKEKMTIELGMKVSVRRSSQNHIGVVTRVDGDYVFVRWTNSDFGETAEYQAHRNDVTPLAGWL